MKKIMSRLLDFFIFFILLSLISFVFIQLLPGDPIKQMLRVDEVAITEEQIEHLRDELKLDEPLYVQYWYWLKRFLAFDLGVSYVTKRPVLDELFMRFPDTLLLTATSLLTMLLISLPLGICSALYKNKWIDYVIRLFSLIGTAVPSFWLGLLLIYTFSVQLHIFPSMGKGTWQHLVLPSLTLGLAMSAMYVRLIRTSLLEGFQKEYVKAARTRGIHEKRIFFFHVFRYALIPIVTLFGMSLGSLIGGTVVVEVLFSYPGVGKLVVDAVMKRDYPMIQGYVLFICFFVTCINILVDFSYQYLNPEIRLKKESRYD
ncbi:ABC transporter permease [Anoxybacillus ayderensis]|nr:ABC transporter permease [Anoxybacillus ayderensis G10]THD17688.1 ABC transporter permease [Anoxybacillus ayderensis]